MNITHYPNLKALRMRANYKQEYLADILSISQPEYSKLENGQKKLSAENIQELCKLYEVTGEELLRTKVNLSAADLTNEFSKALKVADGIPKEILEKVMENYNSLLNSYIHQQGVQEKIITRLLDNRIGPQNEISPNIS